MKKKIITICAAVLFLTALGLTLYPLISNYVNQKYASEIQTAYQKLIQQTDDSVLQEAKQRAIAYNLAITPGTADAYSEESLSSAVEDYESQLDIAGNGIIGYVEIPKIQVNLPIYHGTDAEVLDRGVGHLLGSSLPVGGENTHCVLAAHRGLPSARLFSDIDQLEEGDMIYLHILGEVHAYRVENILPMVPKDDFETLNKALRILHGQDWLSLMTCTPYGINTHRLIVQAKRVAYNGEDDAPTQPVQAVIHYTARSFRRAYTLYIGAAVIILLVVVLILRRRKKRHSPKATPHNSRLTA